MKSVPQFGWFATLMLLAAALLFVGATIPGCSPAPEDSTPGTEGEEDSGGQAATGATEPESPFVPTEELVVEPPAHGPHMVEEPVVEEPVVEPHAHGPHMVEEPVVEEPATEEPATEEPATEEPTVEEPVVEEPAAVEPAVEEPATEEPVLEEPAAEQPAGGSGVSSYAPAEDLVRQVDVYLERLDKWVAEEAEYEDNQGKIAKSANTMALIALALGLHDEENPYKAAAPAAIKASQDLAATTDYAGAVAAMAALRAALGRTDGDSSALAWEKVASLPETMEQVPLINSRLKRALRRFDTMADASAGEAAVLAVIAQGSIANAGDTDLPNETEQWKAFCLQLRDAAAAMNGVIRAQDEDAVDAAKDALMQSCEDCHEVFHEDDDE